MVGSLRSKTFPLQLLEENFGRDHFQEVCQNGKIRSEGPSKGGFPDCGSGRYSDLLSYEAWYKFNAATRIA